ncbi:MAG: hypothetical protein BWY20_01385 [Spirochaetes bacterium ADurb.Bin215]|nr:MAG: hypothetical protein BWY20_01385 [Spirochaetes bacterium ADurb.Bin215]
MKKGVEKGGAEQYEQNPLAHKNDIADFFVWYQGHDQCVGEQYPEYAEQKIEECSTQCDGPDLCPAVDEEKFGLFRP